MHDTLQVQAALLYTIGKQGMVGMIGCLRYISLPLSDSEEVLYSMHSVTKRETMSY